MPCLLRPALRRAAAGAVAGAVAGGIAGGIALAFATTAAAQAPARTWGTFLWPFAADSPWNSRPVEPVLGSATIPTSDYFPAVQDGRFSSAVFLARPSDPPVTVRPLPGSPGVYDADAEQRLDAITIAHWPADTLPAGGGDGHADIVDEGLGVVHSFWQLRQMPDGWHAMQYAWAPLRGRGWGDPAHYFQGARAAGVPTAGGLIRKHELNDGDSQYRHALAMSLTYNGLSANPTYVYPATSADTGAADTNSGAIPEGALLMLPPGFDAERIADPRLRKVARTLKTYGAYVVDRNRGTPFVIYAEIGSGSFTLRDAAGRWDDAAGRELHRMREALRPVVGASAWIDGNGRRFQPGRDFNLLSLRGRWRPQAGDGGSATARFDTWQQALLFEPGPARSVVVNDMANGFSHIAWAKPEAGHSYRLAVNATHGASLRMQLRSCDATPPTVLDSGELHDGGAYTFSWPARPCGVHWTASNGDGAASRIGAELRAATHE